MRIYSLQVAGSEVYDVERMRNLKKLQETSEFSRLHVYVMVHMHAYIYRGAKVDGLDGAVDLDCFLIAALYRGFDFVLHRKKSSPHPERC